MGVSWLFLTSGGGGGGNGDSGGSQGTGGGGGSIIDSSATMVLAEISGVASPNGSPNGEIIITAVPEPTSLALGAMSVMSVLLFRRQRELLKQPVPLERDLF
jgi:PEP-CTERM motif